MYLLCPMYVKIGLIGCNRTNNKTNKKQDVKRMQKREFKYFRISITHIGNKANSHYHHIIKMYDFSSSSCGYILLYTVCILEKRIIKREYSKT